MLLRKPTTIQLKPEDDYCEYEEFKNKQEVMKKGIMNTQSNQIMSQLKIAKPILPISQQDTQFSYQSHLAQLPQFTLSRPIQQMQQESTGNLNNGEWNRSDLVPINQLFQMFTPPQTDQQNQPQ